MTFVAKTLNTLALAAAVIAFDPSAALAQALYAAPPSETSAFVRFVGVAEGDTLAWRDQEVVLEGYSEGAYIALESADIGEEPGDHITVAVADGTVTAEFEEVAREQRKVPVQLLNLADVPVTLKTADGKIAILEDVAPAALSARMINPLSFAVAVEAEGAALVTMDLDVKRGDNPLVVVRADRSVSMINSQIAGAANQ